GRPRDRDVSAGGVRRRDPTHAGGATGPRLRRTARRGRARARDQRRSARPPGHAAPSGRCTGGMSPVVEGPSRRTRQRGHAMQGVDAGAGAGSRFHHEVAALELEWANDDRWKDTRRDYTAEDVVRLRGPVSIEYTLARLGAERFGERLRAGPPIRAACARTDAQALRIVRAGLDALYVSRRNVADRPIHAGQARPDRSLGPGDSAPALVRHINNALLRTDHGEGTEGHARRSPLVPNAADAEAGPGGPLHAFERMKAMIEAGAAAVHFEDQIAVDTMPGRSGG